jgi:hypothetical protein
VRTECVSAAHADDQGAQDPAQGRLVRAAGVGQPGAGHRAGGQVTGEAEFGGHAQALRLKGPGDQRPQR